MDVPLLLPSMVTLSAPLNLIVATGLALVMVALTPVAGFISMDM